jgi:stage III sporulation protein AB
MKFLMILILVIACTYVGFGFSKQYILRYEFFTQLQLFFKKFNLQINFSREKLKPIISEHVTTSKELELILSNFLTALDENDLTNKKLFNKCKLLNEDEKNLLFSFFKSLGHFDLTGQTDHINNYIKNFEFILQSVKEDKEKYGTLFTKLGLIIGVVISLILL